MATTTKLFSLCSSSILTLSQDSYKGPRKSRLMMCCAKNNPVSIHLQIESFDHKINKVFEDTSTGIFCYKDENGEIVCEGYDDECPRFHQQISRFTYNSRDIEIIDLLQRCWFHVSDEKEFNIADRDCRERGT